MPKTWAFNLVSNKWRAFRKWLTLSGYTDYTIASYFRKQGAQIGERCRFQIRSIGSEPYLVSIGNNVFISYQVEFHTHDGGVWILKENDPEIMVYGRITIEDNCLIGIRTQILPNVRIGRNSIIGAGSVVISNVPPNSIVMGVPARVIGSVPKYAEKCLATWQEQRPPDIISNGSALWAYDKANQRKLKKHLLELFKDKGEV